MKTKIAIGCLVMWYEIEIVEEYLKSLRSAIDAYEGKVLVDIVFSTNQDLEEMDVSAVPAELCEAYDPPEYLTGLAAIIDKMHKITTQYGFKFTARHHLYTIADYRRDFNNEFCEKADVLVWGETDMLAPREMFTIIDQVHQETKTPKYVLTFSICKMWDSTWIPLEHIFFTDKPFIEGDTENWWSLRYTMSQEEMYEINDKAEEALVSIINPKKFNGCGLVISSEVIKSGVNIPLSCKFVHEDSAMMMMLNRLLPDCPQYHITNILIVHNRKHPKKRSYIKGEEGIDKTNVGALRKVHSWYERANKLSEENAYNLFNINYKSHTISDLFK